MTSHFFHHQDIIVFVEKKKQVPFKTLSSNCFWGLLCLTNGQYIICSYKDKYPVNTIIGYVVASLTQSI